MPFEESRIILSREEQKAIFRYMFGWFAPSAVVIASGSGLLGFFIGSNSEVC